ERTDFMTSGSGEKSHAKCGTGTLAGARRRHIHLIDQRMPDISHRHIVLAIKTLLERKDDEHAIDDFRDALHPPTPPRPYLWRDVVDDAHAHVLAVFREAEVKVGIVDQHHGVRFLACDCVDHLVQHTPEHAE